MKQAVLFCLIGMGLMCKNVLSQELKTAGEMTVKVECKKAKFLDLVPHALWFYVRKGSTTVDLKTAGQSYRFKVREELSLFGVHRIGSKVYLVFRAEYEPGRGFLAYQANEKGGFDAIAITALPTAAATPNCGSFKQERAVLKFAHTIDELLDTVTIRLWSQMATGKSSASWDLDRVAAQKIWQANEWRPSLQVNVNEVKQVGGTQFRVWIVSFGAGGALFAQRSSWQTLLVAVVCGEGAGFASLSCVAIPRVASLRLG